MTAAASLPPAGSVGALPAAPRTRDNEPPLTADQLAYAASYAWNADHVEMTTVGIDIGSSTTHLMFARVHLRRRSQHHSSQYVVVEREVLWRSPVLLTPYVPDNTIDARRLGTFLRDCYQQAGIESAAVDSGAVILTGEALKRDNARAIADLFADASGTFVCASAGHHLEAVLSAHGSGAVAASRGQRGSRLHIDIGGGTSKIAVLADGEVLGTAAVAVGGRLVAYENGLVVRADGPALDIARAVGIPLRLGGPLAPEDERRLARAFTEVLVSVATRATVPPGYPPGLLLADDRPDGVRPTAVSFSGGVAEYLADTGKESFGDLAIPLAAEITEALRDGRLPLTVLGSAQRIRATVIGASQFTVQVSGNTVGLSSEAALPLRNVPVLRPRLDLSGPICPDVVAGAVTAAARVHDQAVGSDAVAVAVRWPGETTYPRLRALAAGLVKGMSGHLAADRPLVVLLDGDVGRSLAALLTEEMAVTAPLICLDGVELEEFDYVDIGEMVHPSRVVPVVIKSLLFAGADALPAPTSMSRAPAH
ncbi:ethanolamine ammonia-lyase reactivating factor EutA [Streptomyces albipurpureus]|uniref:Ethanolamine ammonia-lyase reactivating factor EutA n=1 Tax=Streptomyces albipurpureus TaxID=2897419 RepID=A0ABT0UYY1_9ACTN|nr:ethanolamine ammonia-lyase reactivating factor EutA [Streptomyces sp. CWNU-1]MCM2393772.1 ethanolamine ammonia-lyase reactivating factor EutA [Streptomyces sp. CWNU-1]